MSRLTTGYDPISSPAHCKFRQIEAVRTHVWPRIEGFEQERDSIVDPNAYD